MKISKINRDNVCVVLTVEDVEIIERGLAQGESETGSYELPFESLRQEFEKLQNLMPLVDAKFMMAYPGEEDKVCIIEIPDDGSGHVYFRFENEPGVQRLVSTGDFQKYFRPADE